MKSFIATLALTSLAQAASINVCQQPEVQQDFDLDRYFGLWYEARRDKDCTFEGKVGVGKCNTATYSMTDDGTIHVLNNEYEDDKGKWQDGFAGKATIVDPDAHEGYLRVKFRFYIPEGDYKVLETDYDNYSVVYTCFGVKHIYNIEYIWILTRDMNPSDEILQKAYDAVKRAVPKYDLNNLHVTETTLDNGDACPYDEAPVALSYEKPFFTPFLQ